jgi:hypothetical protein
MKFRLIGATRFTVPKLVVCSRVLLSARQHQETVAPIIYYLHPGIYLQYLLLSVSKTMYELLTGDRLCTGSSLLPYRRSEFTGNWNKMDKVS